MIMLVVMSLYLLSFLLFLWFSWSLLISLVMLEVFSLIIVFSSFYTLPPMFCSIFVVVSFCIFILESVLGLIGLLNMIYFSGSDYINPSSFIN